MGDHPVAQLGRRRQPSGADRDVVEAGRACAIVGWQGIDPLPQIRESRSRAGGHLPALGAAEGEPLVAQQRHALHVDEAPIAVVRMTQRALPREACLLVGALRALVVGKDVELDALQPQLPEAEVADRVQGISAVTAVPLGLLADQDAEGGAPVFQVDLAQVGGADRPAVVRAGRSRSDIDRGPAARPSGRTTCPPWPGSSVSGTTGGVSPPHRRH